MAENVMRRIGADGNCNFHVSGDGLPSATREPPAERAIMSTRSG